MKPFSDKSDDGFTRRRFLTNTSALGAASLLSLPRMASAGLGQVGGKWISRSSKIRINLRGQFRLAPSRENSGSSAEEGRRRMESVIPLHRILSGSTIALLVLTVAGLPTAEGGSGTSLRGTVESGRTGLAGYEVSLYAGFVGPLGIARVLGRATTRPSGEFKIDYQLPPGLPSSLQPMLFVRAERGPAMLASAIGQAPVAGPVVVNERTTVATGFAFSQFVDGSTIEGNRYGMLNAIRMAANMVHPKTGTVAAVLRLPPNGPETTALLTFNSLANIVAYCVATHVGCQDLSMRPRCLADPSEKRPPGRGEHREIPVAERCQAVRSVFGAAGL